MTVGALEIDGRSVRLTTPERVLWPRVSMTKGQMIDYYIRVAPLLLPYLVDHPITLARFPEGVDGKGFFQTRCPPHPPWVRTQRMHVFTSGKQVDAPVLDDLASLVWAANLASIELHPYLGRTLQMDRPEFVVFDLDPGTPADVLDACRVALRVREVLDDLGLVSLAKTSGGKGMHVYVPTGGLATYATTKPFARALAALIVREDPRRVVDRMDRTVRAGKVFIDWSQNDPGKSTVAPYSLRAKELPTVSTPVSWSEVEAAVDAGDWRRLVFGPGEVLDRAGEMGDLFAPALTLEQTLPPAG